MPPLQKTGLVISSGVISAALHLGATSINQQKHMSASSYAKVLHESNNISQSPPSFLPKYVYCLLDFGNNLSPLLILLSCIYIINSVFFYCSFLYYLCNCYLNIILNIHLNVLIVVFLLLIVK